MADSCYDAWVFRMDPALASSSSWTIFLILQAVSIALLCLGVFEHGRITRNHQALFAMMDRREVPAPERRFGVIVWVYILTTAIVTLLTFVMFIWQPHLL